MAKMNEKKKIATVATTGFLLCAAAGGGVWWAEGLVAESETAIDAAKVSIQAADAKIAKIPDLEKDVIILRENVDAYTKILPDQSEVNDFLRTTERFAYQSGVVLHDFLKGATGKRGKNYSHYSYRLQIEATLWQFMKFINSFENHDRFIRVVQYDLKSAARDVVDRAVASGADPRHEIDLVLETFVYEGKDSGGDIEIPNYAKKRDRFASEIASGAEAVALARYDYVEDTVRRDIFVDPRPSVTGPSFGDNPLIVQKKIIEGFVERIAAARDLHGQWAAGQDYLSKESLARELRDLMTGIEEEAVLAQPRITHQSLLAEWNSTVQQPLRSIWQDLRGFDPEVEAATTLTEERLLGVLEQMRGAAQRGEYESAIRMHGEVAEQLEFPEEDVRFGIAMQIHKTKAAVETLVEFGEIPMSIEGVVVFEEGRSGLLINGQVFEEGEYLDDDLLLKAVAKEQADFVFRGFVVRKKW
ncbi:MAG: type 4a pilus biogenesis protein PilO [Planctomycetota bacterium]|jgi:Tfp pilus assembly protein PilO|nr:type 4a pilus biogenesis protein PilO [Planctomycetota bacterium]MDA0933330.1 type 4a pilus biogenesis protein PilO [Planctomycetota bacterium]MDA1221320.1 type 4a pilus biogenesis protein PilO [Planctomycetota bacterium]